MLTDSGRRTWPTCLFVLFMSFFSQNISILSTKEINSYKFLHCFPTLELVFYFVIPDSLQILFFSPLSLHMWSNTVSNTENGQLGVLVMDWNEIFETRDLCQVFSLWKPFKFTLRADSWLALWSFKPPPPVPTQAFGFPLRLLLSWL